MSATSRNDDTGASYMAVASPARYDNRAAFTTPAMATPAPVPRPPRRPFLGPLFGSLGLELVGGIVVTLGCTLFILPLMLVVDIIAYANGYRLRANCVGNIASNILGAIWLVFVAGLVIGATQNFRHR